MKTINPGLALTTSLLKQGFTDPHSELNDDDLDRFKHIAQTYVTVEKNIAVLSDFSTDKSFLFVSNLGTTFNLPIGNSEINSAFEECVFEKIHPDDLDERHALELSYLKFLKTIDPRDRSSYSTHCRLRIQNKNGVYVYIQHRTIYLKSLENGDVWLSLCLYSPSADLSENLGINGSIINGITGEILIIEKYLNYGKKILSKRETEIITLMAEGYESKEMAASLHLSLFTIHRHRQNILKKLNVKNASQAVNMAMHLGILL